MFQNLFAQFRVPIEAVFTELALKSNVKPSASFGRSLFTNFISSQAPLQIKWIQLKNLNAFRKVKRANRGLLISIHNIHSIVPFTDGIVVICCERIHKKCKWVNLKINGVEVRSGRPHSFLIRFGRRAGPPETARAFQHLLAVTFLPQHEQFSVVDNTIMDS